MIRKCMDCEKIMGIKAPIFSLAVTTAICDRCLRVWRQEFKFEKSAWG